MDKIKKLSEAIRYGSTFLGESQTWITEDKKCGCALGTAYLATIDPDPTSSQICGNAVRKLSTRYGVPKDILDEVSYLHFTARKTRAECADYLEQLGY